MVNIVYTYMERDSVLLPNCWQRILELEQEYDIHREQISRDNPYGYWEAINKYWGQDNLILIEHDHLIEPEMLDSLLSCPEPACCYYYTTSIDRDHLNIGYRISDPTFNMLLAEKEYKQLEQKILSMGQKPYVTFSGMGLTKISKKLQHRPLEKFGIRNVPGFDTNGLNADNAIISNINSQINAFMRFHVHGKVPHLHPNIVDDNAYENRYKPFQVSKERA